jgi:hypothetical protein
LDKTQWRGDAKLANDEDDEIPPGPEALAAIEAALREPRTLRVVFAYARKRVYVLHQAGIGFEFDADDLVHQALSDTIEGKLTWSPEAVALSTHLHRAIQTRVWKLLNRRQPSEPEDSIDAAVAKRDSDPTGQLVERREVARKVKEHLLQAASEKNDEGVVYLLMAYEQGVEGRSALGSATGLSPAEVTNARKRLDRLVAALPAELLGAAKKVMN